MSLFSGRTLLLVVILLLFVMFTQIFSLGWDTSGLSCLKHQWQHSDQQYQLVQIWHLKIYERPVNYVCLQQYNPKTGQFVPVGLTGDTQP